MNAVETALRDPTPDDIPRDVRGSYVERLRSIAKMIRRLHVQYDRVPHLAMLAEKLDGVASDMAADETKETL